MAIFGKPVARQPYGIAPYMDQLNTVQQYGGPVADPRAGVMMQAQDKAMQPKAFEKGGKGWQVLGVIGDALQVAGGGRATYADAQRWWQEQEAEREKTKAALQARMSQPSNAARMAMEAGLQPGSADFQQFVRRYAFQPKFMTVGNAMGGEDTIAVDPSGLGGPATGLQPGHVEDGYVYIGGDPSNESSWRRQ